MKSTAIFLCTAAVGLAAAQTTNPMTISPAQLEAMNRAMFSPTFRLFFLGHEIGAEASTRPGLVTIDTFLGGPPPVGPFHTTITNYDFRFIDRGTEVAATGSVELDMDNRDAPFRFYVKGRNYRLFASDSAVEIRSGRAHVRDFKSERDIELGGKAFFPIDNYAPIGVQEALVRYWLKRGQPAEIASTPSGPIRIKRRGVETVTDQSAKMVQLDRLSIDGLVWGTETAWFDRQSSQLVALTTWAGALPFEAVRVGYESRKDQFIGAAIRDRIADLSKLTWTIKPRATSARGPFALVGARIIQGTDAPPIEHGTVIVRDGRIAGVGPQASTAVPPGATRIDVTGKTIIAGLWDSHAHASQTDWAPVYLASGVTTIRDLGGEEMFLIAIRDAIASGQALGPRYLLAGLIDGPGPRAFGMVTASTPDEARAVVRRYHDEHFQEIKIYIETPAALVPVITAEAHRLGMTVTGHLPAGLTWQTAVENGYDGIAHMQLRGTPDSEQTRQQIAFFEEHHTVMDPTLSWNELSGRSMAQPLDALLPGAARLPLPLKRMFDSMSGGNGGSQASSAKLIKAAVDAGLTVMAGTDKGVPGFSLQRELEIYVQGGLTPLQAIQTATIMPARAMKLERDLGTIEVGKFADLVVLDANPLDNISNIRTARMVLSNGRLYDCNALWRAAGFGER